jgi:hypothetical protein
LKSLHPSKIGSDLIFSHDDAIPLHPLTTSNAPPAIHTADKQAVGPSNTAPITIVMDAAATVYTESINSSTPSMLAHVAHVLRHVLRADLRVFDSSWDTKQFAVSGFSNVMDAGVISVMSSSLGVTPLGPAPESDRGREPGLELDLAREPVLELDLASGALLPDRDRDFVLCARHTCKAIKSQTMNQIRIIARIEMYKDYSVYVCVHL